MKISKKEDFGLIFMNILSNSPGGKFISLADISAGTNLPLLFLKHIASNLLKKKLIISKEGLGGGYMLARKPSDIKVSEILTALSSEGIALPCNGKKCRMEKRNCICQSFWFQLNSKIMKYLESISLEDFSKK